MIAKYVCKAYNLKYVTLFIWKDVVVLDSKEIIKKLINNKGIKLSIISFSAYLIMFLIFILLVLVFIGAMFSGLLVIIIGPIYTYMIRSLIMGLIVPLCIIFIIAFLLKIFAAFFQTNLLNIIKNYSAQFPSKAMKQTAVIIIACVFAVFFLAGQTQKTFNVVIDIPNVINHQYGSIDGIVEIQTDTGDNSPFVLVDNITFNEGFVFKPGIINGKRYHVEYLPHTRYIVDFTLIE